MSAPFRFGLIGGGRMGRTHLRGLADSTEVTVVAVTEPVERSVTIETGSAAREANM